MDRALVCTRRPRRSPASRCARFFGCFGRRLAILTFLAAVAAATRLPAAACDGTIYGVDVNGALWSFMPPSANAARAPGNPTLPFGTIARGVFSGNIFTVAGTTSNSALYMYDTSAHTETQVGTFPNTSFLYASGFSSDGYGYVMSSTEVYTFADSTTPQITYVGAPQTSTGPPISAFNSGDLAIDLTNNGWVILSNNSTGLSYLYKVAWGTQTVLSPVAQITLNGTAYTAADLYSLAFDANGTLYTSSGTNGTLYSINQTSGALTSIGGQGATLLDFASCPFPAQPTFRKIGPSKVGNGELVSYALTASLSTNAKSALTNVKLLDTVPTGITVVSATCPTTLGAVCATPTIVGQQVNVKVSTLPPGAMATLRINGRNTGLPLGPVTNVGTMQSQGVTWTWSATTTVVANTVSKTVANVTQAGLPGLSIIASPGDVVEYVVSYTNYTNVALAAFAFTDTIPTNSSYVANSAACVTTPAPLACTPSGPTAGVLSWSYSGGALQPGQTVSVRYRSTIL